MSSQISALSLAELLEQHTVKIIDGSWALDGTDMHALYLKDHIKSSQFFDLEAISDHTTSLPHMAPTPVQFAEAVGKLGISADDHVVIYDRQGLFSAARVWWTFKLMGHARIQVLKGGLPTWKASGYAVTDVTDTPVPTTYVPEFKPDMVMDLGTLETLYSNSDYMIFDARSRARFHGTAPEPRAGLRSGHIPQSQSLPWTVS